MPAVQWPDRLGDIIDAVYGAARGTEPWDECLKLINKVFPGTKLAFTSEDAELKKNIGIVTYGYEPKVIQDYQDYYASVNPWIPLAMKIPLLTPVVSDRLYPSVLFKNTEFYAGFIEAAGEAESASGIKLVQEQSRFAALSIHYGHKIADTYNHELPIFLQALAPHLKNAVELMSQSRSSEHLLQTVTGLIDHLPTAAFLLDGAGRVHAMNAKASELLGEEEGIAVLDCEDRLLPIHAVAAAALHSLLNTPPEAPDPALLDKGPPTAWRFLEFPIGSPDVHSAWLPGLGKWILAIYTVATRGSNLTEKDLVNRYRLTQKEAVLTLSLMHGTSLYDTADELGIGKQTARHHLKAVFAKTRTHRQAELVAKIARLTLSVVSVLAMADEFT